MTYRVGVDVGGTFTDVLLIDSETSEITAAKVPTVPSDVSSGVINGIVKACDLGGVSPEEITHFLHGTTIATNAVLTGGGSRVGLIVTRGFRDVLHIARSHVPGDYAAWVAYEKSQPMAALEATVEIDERVSAHGEILETVDEQSVKVAAETLKEQGVEVITVSLINSYANDTNELRVRALLEELLPDMPVSISSRVVPEIQEYERTLTTVANSYVRPVVDSYISALAEHTRSTMPSAQLRILKSDGGLTSADNAAEFPVNLLMSGPAGGVTGALWVAEQAGFKNIITFDVGGTSTDVALVEDGQAQLRRETMIGDVSVRASSIDVRTVGAGGGSIAKVPEITGALRVGPESAGAKPGPAAYGHGGTEPTVTDAHVVMGLLPADTRLGGDLELDREAAQRVVAQIGEALEISTEDAAASIVDIANENMYGALRLVSLEQGFNPQDFALVAFGGAGPLHANAVGKLLGSWPVIIPRSPGVLCAYGDVTTRVRQERSRTSVREFVGIDVAGLRAEYLELIAEVESAMDGEKVPRDQRTMTLEADIRYVGQSDAITIPLSVEELTDEGIVLLGKRFDEAHEKLNTFSMTTLDRQFVSLRAICISNPMVAAAEHLTTGTGSPENAKIGESRAYMNRAWHETPVYDRSKLLASDVIVGPAIIQEMDSTSVILPDHTAVIDIVGNILIRPAGMEGTKQ
ncbi:hydantoinase/oxoprolinase family protein [Nocardia veterana]|uniref:Hydantoinase/oxoprolinase family protein n=1 Tax=Nocardia veterana TaxID=132249 RepID=A0A7X6RKZ9_9NOCA|nr:hydantoinase/oxoprolinase family protein [Nocardia veterana]NKY89811.1 hydantoinase/oxoprolinase family protein [Nocardia veterana]